MPDFPSPPIAALSDPNSEESWEARSDAETLKRAEVIKADSRRVANARYMLEREDAERKAALESLS